MHGQFPHLFSPFKLGKLTLKNRIVFGPHYTALADDHGMCTPEHAFYFAERAKNGVGLIIIENAAVLPNGKMAPRFMNAWDPAIIPAWRRITNMVHACDVPIFGQLTHGGNTSVYAPPVHVLWAPSEMPEPSSRHNCKEMEQEEIDEVVRAFDKGYAEFMNEYWPRIRPEQRQHPEIRHRKNEELLEASRVEGQTWGGRGIEPPNGGFAFAAFDLLCQMRSHAQFVLDVFRRPGVVEQACEVATETIIRDALQSAERTGLKKIIIGLHRSSYFNPEPFEKLSFPFLKHMVEVFVRAGLTPVLHCDGNWNAHLSHLLDLPRATCIVQLDGMTDIFRAREILGGHTCIQGDVPAALTTSGTPEEVAAYCKRLIAEVGGDGGFILASGCDVPITAKRENILAMVAAAKEYGRPC